MRRLVAWELMTLDGYFEGRNPWDLGFHETVWGDELEASRSSRARRSARCFSGGDL